MPPEAKDVKPLMDDLVNWIETEMDKNEIPASIIAGITHYQFATIHPIMMVMVEQHDYSRPLFYIKWVMV